MAVPKPIKPNVQSIISPSFPLSSLSGEEFDVVASPLLKIWIPAAMPRKEGAASYHVYQVHVYCLPGSTQSPQCTAGVGVI